MYMYSFGPLHISCKSKFGAWTFSLHEVQLTLDLQIDQSGYVFDTSGPKKVLFVDLEP